MLPPSPLVTCGVPIGCSEWLRPDVIAPEFGCSTAGCHGDEDKWGDSRVGTSHSLQIQIRNPWVEVRECWSQTTHWPFQLISQGFLLKFKGGPVSGVSCFVMTYYQYHAHETKGFFLISPCNTHRSCCVSPFGTAVALLLFAGFEKGLWVGIIGAASDYTSLFLEGLLIRIFEIENSCMILKKFSAGKINSIRSSLW